jgi:hypothetical protein
MNIESAVLQAMPYGEEGATLEPAVISETPHESVHDLLVQDDPPSEAVAASPAPARRAQPATPVAIQTQNLPEIYAQAGIRVPAHGCSILKVAEMLGSVHVRDLAPDAKRAAVLMALEATSVQLSDVIEDATRREHVLNDYEARQQQAFQNYKTAKQEQNQQIQAEIEHLTEQLRLSMQANEKEVASEKTRLDEWRTKKREEERRIRNAVSHFGGSSPASQAGNSDIPSPRLVPQPDAAAASAAKNGAGASASGDSTTKPASQRPSLWKR